METLETSYSLPRSAVWRETLDEGLIKFSDVKPGIPEKSSDELKKKGASTTDKFELSEANMLKIFKTVTQSTPNVGRLYYYPSTESCYNIIEVKKDAEGKVESVKMVKQHGSDEVTLSKESDIKTLRDYVIVNISIFNDNVCSDILNLQIKLQTKLENEIATPLQGATGKVLTMFKFFQDSNLVDKEMTLSNLRDVKDEMIIIAAAGFSKPYIFKRFKKPYEWPYWGYYGTTIDAVAFVPNQNVIFAGFTLYSTDQPSFECKYKIYVDDNVVEEDDTLKCSDWEDKFYYRIKLKGLHEVKAGSKLEIACQIAKSFADNGYISCYYGDGGDSWKEVENEHMGLWAVEYSSKSGSSSVGYGNFPEIMYYV